MINYEYYKVADEIIKRLQNEGFANWAQKLDDAIAGGATGTEIFMALRFNLNKLKAEQKGISKETLELIRDLIFHLNVALK
ncbi:MAG: hypothetical protein A2298_02060 [Gammaproteobacteria bacterium RIFOXYB2_FULL_38_6]|nr:MAG: hypothetical protein A2298_02060 [Gammaproteobacteria bacterium RIFOXYB2_FULL_38_6]